VVNPASNHCHIIWQLKNFVKTGTSANRAYTIAKDYLTKLLNGDPGYSGYYVRNPFYEGHTVIDVSDNTLAFKDLSSYAKANPQKKTCHKKTGYAYAGRNDRGFFRVAREAYRFARKNKYDYSLTLNFASQRLAADPDFSQLEDLKYALPASAHQIARFCSTELDKTGMGSSFWTDQNREKSIVARKASASVKLDFALSLNCSKRIIIKKLIKMGVSKTTAYRLLHKLMNMKDNYTITGQNNKYILDTNETGSLICPIKIYKSDPDLENELDFRLDRVLAVLRGVT
jgi:hypothetical protein